MFLLKFHVPRSVLEVLEIFKIYISMSCITKKMKHIGNYKNENRRFNEFSLHYIPRLFQLLYKKYLYIKYIIGNKGE